MLRAIKAEALKLLTTRSTYVLLALCLAMLILFAFYIEGFRLTQDIKSPDKLADAVVNATTTVSLLIAIRSLLLITHEYAHGTIMYTLTASRSWLTVFVAKIIVASVFTIVATLVLAALSPLLMLLGTELKGLDMVAQNVPYLDLLWRTAFYAWAYSMFAVIFAFLIRNQVGSIVTFLVVPTTLEGLLTLLLKQNGGYLPFSALNSVIMQIPPFSPGKAALVASVYLLVGLVVAALLFKKRDAN